MCSFFLKKMENDQGDLADILRVTGGGGAPITGFDNPVTDWQFPIESMDFPVGIDEPNCDFSDPFPNDPLLRELDIASSMFFDGSNYASNQNGNISMMVTENENFNNVLDHQEIKKPYQLFSKMLQISPKMEIGVNNSSKKTGVVTVENSNLQPSSPRNPVIKRRKSQTKKVVCIPAPAAATSRPSGEVVPSDLWAWRKYGQKPIKGSPYPRGYYRCSSSKGCSARKQVERSRTDPNMLVITYTSEHNHPWPTQRNALAGSTRSQPLKNSSSSSKSSPSPQTIKPVKVEMVGDSIVTSETVKEEMGDGEKQMDDQEFEESFVQTYRPIPPNQNQGDDFFAELGELEVDPVDLMFPQGFMEGRTEGGIENKYLDPFDLFDWSKNSFGETRRGL